MCPGQMQQNFRFAPWKRILEITQEVPTRGVAVFAVAVGCATRIRHAWRPLLTHRGVGILGRNDRAG